MKTFLLFLTALAFTLAGAHLLSGQTPGVPLVIAGAVAACISTWTFLQYERKYPPLSANAKLLRPSRDAVAHDASLASRRRAA